MNYWFNLEMITALCGWELFLKRNINSSLIIKFSIRHTNSSIHFILSSILSSLLQIMNFPYSFHPTFASDKLNAIISRNLSLSHKNTKPPLTIVCINSTRLSHSKYIVGRIQECRKCILYVFTEETFFICFIKSWMNQWLISVHKNIIGIIF